MLPDFVSSSARAAIMPADYEPGDPFPAPAPTPSGNVNLSTFNGGSANGTWALYIVDDAGADVGNIGDWSLNVSAGRPATTSASATASGLADSCADAAGLLWRRR